MIVEVPAPQGVGSNSRFVPQIRYTRRVVTTRFHPSDVWDRAHLPIQITGAGYFEFKHGQSGTAPNSIKLHPVLNVKIGASGSSPPPPATHPTAKSKPQPGGSGSFTVSAYVNPNPVSYGQYATLYAKSVQGAVCTASVLYSTGRPPRSFSGSPQTVGAEP